MSKLQAYFQLSLADFRERTRRSSFLVTLLGILFFGYLVITGKYTVQFGEFRTVYDSTWAGSLMATCSSIMMALVGFYLIRGSVKRDRQTEVGQIIAATPLSKRAYITAKFLSNCLVLWFMTTVLATVGFVTLLFRNEAGSIDVGAYVLPFLLISLPATVFVAAVTVFFDTARWLRGSIGNVIYLFLAEFCIVMGMLQLPLLDLGGVALFTDSVRTTAEMAFPGEKIGLLMGFVMFDPAMKVETFRVFSWSGIEWTASTLMTRLFWPGAGLVALGLAIPLFDRFDPTLNRVGSGRGKKRSVAPLTGIRATGRPPGLTYSALTKPAIEFSFLKMATAELRLALKGYHWFWYAVAAGLVIAQLAAPFEIARQYITPVSMIWPLVIWSSMGNREFRFNTDMLLISSPGPLTRQLPAVWLSGVIVALASVAIMLIRSLITGHFSYTATLALAALLVPGAALALGVLSRSKRLFEVVYLMIWYIGSIEHASGVDILGTSDESITVTKFVVISTLAALFAFSAFVARRSQVLRA